MRDSIAEKPRLIIADDNIRDTGGHYFELASLLLAGANELGYRGVLATSASFDEGRSIGTNNELVPTFRVRRMIRWSLGVDGRSRFERDLLGRSIGGESVKNAWINLADRLRPRRCPTRMLDHWADDLAGLLQRLDPGPRDSLLINTGDDFAMLALAAAMQRCQLPPLRIDVILHFALCEKSQVDRKERLRQIGRQLRRAVGSLASHRVHLHATTPNLASQFRDTQCGLPIRSIPYPTRASGVHPTSPGGTLKAVLAGLPRAEKGKNAIVGLLADIEAPLLRTRRFRLSMQMPSKRWKAMIPPSLHADFQRAVDGVAGEPLEIMTNNLSTDQYHQWLDTADVGLFLYDPDRYVARCSGVLLEMLARGVPVIVPDGCWLADQVRIAGGHGSIGYIYRDRASIAQLLSRLADEYEAIAQRLDPVCPENRGAAQSAEHPVGNGSAVSRASRSTGRLNPGRSGSRLNAEVEPPHRRWIDSPLSPSRVNPSARL